MKIQIQIKLKANIQKDYKKEKLITKAINGIIMLFQVR
jgi:hypothetical protein